MEKNEFSAVMEIPFSDAGVARKAYASLIQETEFTKKSKAGIKVVGSKLTITITANDFASFRATVNSYSRLLAVFFGAKDVVEEKEE